MGRVLPILFNTDMVRAILDGRKTVTRRVIKTPPHPDMPDNHNYCRMPLWMRIGKNEYGFRTLHYMDVVGQSPYKQIRYFESLAPFDKDDILYVRETFRPLSDHPAVGVEYAADWSPKYFENSKESNCCNRGKWIPSIHMPKQVARIWLKVTDVRVERLQNIDTLGCQREGIDITRNGVFKRFSTLWDSTLKKKDLVLYGWEANPWVWVIEFEHCEKPES